MALYSKEDQSNITIFLAEWDEALGPIVKTYLNTEIEINDVEIIAMNIFSSFQMIFGESSSISFKRTFLTIPLNSQNQIARILLDIIPDSETRGGFLPFIVTILTPDTVSEEKMPQFDGILLNIVTTYKEQHEISLPSYKSEIKQTFKSIQEFGEDRIEIDENYSLTNAVEDFTKGVNLYKQKIWETAYLLLKKALLKFTQEKQIKMKMETTYLISTILIQLKKFQPAMNYYISLEQNASELAHKKYYELALFMQGFCQFKMNNLADALDIFNKIQIFNTQYINKVQFYSIKGQIKSFFHMYQDAIKEFMQAITILESKNLTRNELKQYAQILNDIGLQNYKEVISLLKIQGFSLSSGNINLKSKLEIAISYYQKAIQVWEQIRDYKNIIHSLQIVANIYGFLQDSSKQLETLIFTIKKVDNINNYNLKLNISFQIVGIYEKLGNYDEIIDFLQIIGTQLTNNAFVDLLSIAKIHFNIAKAYIALNQKRNALGELIMALNNLKNLKNPVSEELDALSLLIKIYNEENDLEKSLYYADRYEKAQKKYIEIKPIAISRLGVIKDFWVYTDAGLELFSHAPEVTFDPILLGGFLTAMQSFSIELSHAELQSLIIGESKYSFYKESGKIFYILGRTKENIHPPTIEATLKKIYQIFDREFSKDLASFNGNTIAFTQFEKILGKIDLNLS